MQLDHAKGADRRQQRSARPVEALSLFLEATRARLGVRALTLGTLDGWIIAGAGADLEEVHAAGISAVSSPAQEVEPELGTWQTRIFGSDVVITSWGRALSADLADGVRRILGDRPATAIGV
jgi:hypothetical protein